MPIVCPECGSGAVERDYESSSANAMWCDECGYCFEKKFRKPSAPRKNESPEDAATKAFGKHAQTVGINPELYGREAVIEGIPMKLLEINMRRNLPFIFMEMDGTRCCAVNVARMCELLGLPKPETPTRDLVYADEARRKASSFGIDPSLVGRIFPVQGQKSRFVGIKPRVRTQPVSLQYLDTSRYVVCTVEHFRTIWPMIQPEIA